MKKLFGLLICGVALFNVSNVNAQHSLKKLWETDSVLNIPESVLPAKNVMYVSLIDGEGWVRDGKGGVAKLTTAGKVIDANWITGLNAPKGMAIKGDLLYVGDLDELVVISISQNKIQQKIKISGAQGLNDVSVDKDGNVYVTDTKKACVFKVDKNGEAALFLENMKGANGVKAIGDKVYVLTGDGMYVTGADKKLTKICTLEFGGDGIEPIGNGDFLVTAWAGYFYYVHADGTKEILLDTHITKKRTADIGYDPKLKIVYVPTFLGKSVDAYKLQ